MLYFELFYNDKMREVSRYEHLHQFLDNQLHGVISKEKEKPTFDNIENKLKKI